MILKTSTIPKLNKTHKQVISMRIIGQNLRNI